MVFRPISDLIPGQDEQILDLLRDLSDAIRDKDSGYFLGTIVLARNNKGTHFRYRWAAETRDGEHHHMRDPKLLFTGLGTKNGRRYSPRVFGT